MKLTLKKVNVCLLIIVLLMLLLNSFYFYHLNKQLKKNNTKGTIYATVIKTDCEECFPHQAILESIRELNLNIKELVIDFKTRKAKKLMKMHNITRLPAFILEGNVPPELLQVFRLSKDAFVFESVPPYYDIAENKTKGLVDIIKIVDNTCKECYDIENLKNALAQGLQIKFQNEKFIDINTKEGREILEKYNITKIPTMLLSSEISAYASAVQVWQNIGEIAKDGMFIFTKPELLQQPYKNVESGKIIT